MKSTLEFSSITLLTLCLVLSSCTGDGGPTEAADGRLRVLATTGMVGDLVRNIGGDAVEVTTLMGPGVDPHLYKASAGDLDDLQAAEMIFYNGLELEGKMEDILQRIGDSGTPVFAVGDLMPEEQLLSWAQYEGKPDPHIWFDVSMWAATIDGVSEALVDQIPAAAEVIRANAAIYRQELADLHEWCLEQIDTIPNAQRVLITAHDAFQYFGEAYGMDVVGLQGISTDSEYGPRDIERITTIITERGIKAVFIESSVNPGAIEAVVEGARAMGQQVTIGGELFSDAMGAKGTEEGTYIGMVRHNITTIVSALR